MQAKKIRINNIPEKIKTQRQVKHPNCTFPPNLQNSRKSNKNAKSIRKRPQANVSSHNVRRFGYPFFLSPSDDDAMLEIPNPIPSVHQTPCYFYCYYCFPRNVCRTGYPFFLSPSDDDAMLDRICGVYIYIYTQREREREVWQLPNQSLAAAKLV